MIETLKQLDEHLFLFLNSRHCLLCDTLMWYVSKMWFWTPVYLWMLILLFRRKSPLNAVIALISIACVLFFTDFVAVKLIKETVMRLRPSHNPRFEGLVHLVQDEFGNFYKGGRYGFFSNHASNFAGVATLFLLLVRPIKFWIGLLIAIWVVVIGYSRVYLGVHYPLDVLVGFAYGGLVGYLFFVLYSKFEKKEVAS